MADYKSCTSETLTSIDARCDKSMGGIKRVLIANHDDVSGVTVNDTTGEITNIAMASGKTFAEYCFRRETGSYTSTIEKDVTIGNVFAKTEVTLQFSKAEAAKRLAIQSAINANAVVIIEDSAGEKIYLGIDYPVEVTNATMVSGTAMGDLNGFTMVLSDVAKELPHFISSTVNVDALKV